MSRQTWQSSNIQSFECYKIPRGKVQRRVEGKCTSLIPGDKREASLEIKVSSADSTRIIHCGKIDVFSQLSSKKIIFFRSTECNKYQSSLAHILDYTSVMTEGLYLQSIISTKIHQYMLHESVYNTMGQQKYFLPVLVTRLLSFSAIHLTINSWRN
jgi:hypothetical protein